MIDISRMANQDKDMIDLCFLLQPFCTVGGL